ncbi:MAG: tetratricopeptide repeat protein [Candidatus Obscuribacterales bacterium]
MNFGFSFLSVCLVMNLLLPSALFPGRVLPTSPENRALTAEEKRGGLGAAVLLELLADMTMSAEDFLDAEVLYRRTRELYQVCGDAKCLARCSAKLAIVLAEENKLSASKIESEQALKYYSQLSTLEKDKGAILHNLGWIAAQQGDIDEACSRYMDAVRYYSLFKSDNLADVLGALSKRSLARLYFQQRKYGAAAEYYRECLTTLERKLKRHSSMTEEVRREYKQALLRSKDSR